MEVAIWTSNLPPSQRCVQDCVLCGKNITHNNMKRHIKVMHPDTACAVTDCSGRKASKEGGQGTRVDRRGRLRRGERRSRRCWCGWRDEEAWEQRRSIIGGWNVWRDGGSLCGRNPLERKGRSGCSTPVEWTEVQSVWSLCNLWDGDDWPPPRKTCSWILRSKPSIKHQNQNRKSNEKEAM